MTKRTHDTCGWCGTVAPTAGVLEAIEWSRAHGGGRFIVDMSPGPLCAVYSEEGACVDGCMRAWRMERRVMRLAGVWG